VRSARRAIKPRPLEYDPAMDSTVSRRAHLRHGIGPLAGASVVLTRPAGSSRALRRRVLTLGGEALELPGLSLRIAADPEAARAALRATRGADVVVFSSPAAVRFAFALWPGLRIARRVRVCAIGAATARALRRRGLPEVSHPVRQDSEGLLALPEFIGVRGKRVALIGAPGGRDLLPQALRTRGARLERVYVYERCLPRFTPRRLAALECAAPPLVILLSSAEALANLHVVLPPALFLRLREAELVVSSARLAAVAHTHGFVNVHVAASPQPADLVAAAQIALARHRL